MVGSGGTKLLIRMEDMQDFKTFGEIISGEMRMIKICGEFLFEKGGSLLLLISTFEELMSKHHLSPPNFAKGVRT